MRYFLRDQRGQATVEFAVTLPIMLLLIMGVIYFGKAFYKEQQVQLAARYICWKAGRHDGNHALGPAQQQAMVTYDLQGASIQGQASNDTLENLAGQFGFNGNIWNLQGNPSSVPSFITSYLLNPAAIGAALATGIAPVDTHYTVNISQPMGTQLLPIMQGYNIDRTHKVDIGHWDYAEINGDVLILGYELYLDAWAYDEITGLCSGCI